MTQGASQFTGLAGEYYVSYCLAVRGYHASITIGNAPNVDVLVASADGKNLISIQVKTSRWAHRIKRYGYEVYEWDVGSSAIGRNGENIWYAFVDLQDHEGKCEPQVFLVPSLWVSDFVKPEHSRKMYLLKADAARMCHEKWDFIRQFFDREQAVINWTNSIPVEAKWC